VHVGFALLTLFPGRVGGTETYVRGLLGEFAAGRGPERVTILANRHVMASYGGWQRGPVSLHHVRSYRPGDGTLTRALAMISALTLPRRAARDVPAGLDLVHYPVTVPIPATDAPRVVTIHDLQHLDMPDFFPRAERLLRRRAYEGAARDATLVIANSEYTKRRLVETAGVPAGRIEAIHLGVDTERFSTRGEDDDRVLAEHDLPERFVVYPANLWPHKNHARLLEALAATRDRELSLVLTGQGYGRLDELLARARALGVEPRIRHLGYVTAETLPALYRRAVAMVYPSLYEGFGVPTVEAMACGCPVAASPRGSLGEVCGDAALMFDPESPEEIADALDRLAADAALRERLRAAGLERAARFTWRAAAERHVQVYRRALAESSATTTRQ
jgi:glycosyltransferase involved in cell wall biosynthesis